MPVFTFKAVDSRAQEVADEVEAKSIEEASNLIKGMGYFPTEIRPKSGKAPAPGAPRPGRKKTWAMGGVRLRELAQFTTQLSILNDAGLPIVRSLQILEGQQKAGVLKNALMDVTDDVESGSSLSDALSRHPKVFNTLFVNMVRAGEAGGVLDIILDRLAKFLERAQKLRSTVKGAMTYPIVIGVIALTILMALMIGVVPKFERIFKESKIDLPILTKFVINVSSGIMSMVGVERVGSDISFHPEQLLIDAVVLVALVVFLIFLSKSRAGRRIMDFGKLYIPVIGPVMRKSIVTRFCRTLGTLIASNVSLLDALRICRGAIGNIVLAEAIDRVHDSIREGESIADPLRACGLFDEIVVNMVAVGEETGELDKMLLKIADSYDAEVETAVTNMVRLLEPLFIVVMGVGVGTIVIALFLPLTKMLTEMSK